MKYKAIIFLMMISLVMVIMKPGMANAEEGMTADDLYINEIHFTSFVDAYGGAWSIKYTLEENQNYVSVQRNNETKYGYKFAIPVSSVNTGYYYVSSLNGADNTAIVGFKIWRGTFFYSSEALTNIPRQTELTFGLPPKPEPGDWSNFKAKLTITEPSYDGYPVTSQRLTIYYRYGLPKLMDGFGNEIFADVTGATEVARTHELLSFTSDNDYDYKSLRLDVKDIPNGENVPITLSISRNGVTYFDTIYVNKYSGIIDEDGDGIDDRTGKPIDGDVSELTPDGAPLLPENATIFDYVKYAVDSIIYVFAQTGLTIKGLIGGIGDIGKILTGFFSYMPQPFTGIIVIGLLIAIILRIFGR